MPGEKRFVGALLGTFVGDALGMPVEGWDGHSISRKFGELREMQEARLGRGTYTDDTEMMIGVAESLIKNKGFNAQDMANTLAGNMNPQRGYGGGTIKTLSLIRQGVSWERAGAMVFPDGSYGNGAAMRIAPVGCLYFDRPLLLTEVAQGCSYLTHRHPLGVAGALLQARAVSLALASQPGQLDPEKFIRELESYISNISGEYAALLQSAGKLLAKGAGPEEVVAELGNDVRAYRSVCTAIYAFLVRGEDFEEAVVYAVGFGGDTDTIGAMCGALAGAYHGVQAIPARWLDALENGPKGRDYVEHLGRQLWKLYLEIKSDLEG